MSEVDADPTDEERREAEALALGNAPADAAPALALLEASRDGGLAQARKKAVGSRVFRSAPARRAPWRRVAWALPLAAGLVAALWWMRGGVPVPRPGEELLQAQAGAARGDAEGRVRLEGAMRGYRRGMLRSLGEKYR